jgi:hypothetical protein
MCFVFTYEDEIMKPAGIVIKRGKEKDEGEQ